MIIYRFALLHSLSAILDFLQSAVGRAFPVAAGQVRCSLPKRVTFAPSVAVFWSRFKTHFSLFRIPAPRRVLAHWFGHPVVTYYARVAVGVMWDWWAERLLLCNTKRTTIGCYDKLSDSRDWDLSLPSMRSCTLALLPGTNSQEQSAKLRHEHFLRNF